MTARHCGVRIIEHGESFELVSPDGRSLCYIYFEDRLQRQQILRRLPRDEAHRLAQAIAASASSRLPANTVPR